MMGGMLVPVQPVDKAARAIETLFGVDPEFVTLCKTLYGEDVDPVEVWTDVFGKDNPSGADMHVPGNLQIDRRRARQGARRGKLVYKALTDRQKRGMVAGASAAGAVAGGVGLAAGVRGVREAGGFRNASKLTRGLLIAEPIGLTGEIGSTKILGNDVKQSRKQKAQSGTKAARDDSVEKIGIGALADGLEAGMRKLPGLGGLAPKVKPAAAKATNLGNDVKSGYNAARSGQSTLPKDTPRAMRASHATTSAAQSAAPGMKSTLFGSRKRTAATLTGTGAAAYGAGSMRKRDEEEDLDVVWQGEFEKFDEDKRLVFGWASVVEVNGSPVVDRQGDYIHPDDLENASYEYVIKSRVGGDMHTRNGAVPFKVSDLVESMVVTPEKLEKMGIPAAVAKSMPVGWWVGFKVHSDKHWSMVKKQARTGFSIHGRGKRIPMTMDQIMPGYH